jgi:hypothetical protein
MAPLTEDFLAPAPSPLPPGLPGPAIPSVADSFPDPFAASPAPPVAAASVFAPQPVPATAAPRAAPPVAPEEAAAVLAPPTWAPPAVAPTTQPASAAQAPTTQANVISFGAEQPAPAQFVGGPGPSAFTLERHSGGPRSGNGPLDWVAFVLAFLAPPLGLVVGVGAIISGSRSRGYATGIAKAAIGIGAALTIVLGTAFVVVTKIDNDQAAHDAIVASSRAYCAKLKSDPTTLSSDTFGWPSPGNTVPESITAMEAYQANWEALAKLAPSGIRSDTEKIAATAKSIVATVTSSQTLNDSGNVAQMQNVVSTSGIHAWVSDFCS